MGIFRSPILFIGFIIILVGGATGYFLFKDTTPPQVTLNSEAKRVAPGQKFTVTVSDADTGIKSVTISIRKNSQMQVLSDVKFSEKQPTQTVAFALKDTFLRDGAFTLIINARDASFAGFGQGNSATREYSMTMDTTPPRATIKTAHPYVRRGGTGCVSYTLSREVASTGVKVGDAHFPSYQQENGDWVCFFAFPHYLTSQEYNPEIVITDLADNVTTTRLPVYRVNQKFKKDVVKINDSFLALKMPEFQAQIPNTPSPLELFNKVNGELRHSNAAKLMEIGKTSAPVALWQDSFIALPNAAVKAGFAEHRTYMYNGEKQEVEATHLGLDLASIAKSPVPAANSGVVVFADYLGIYGNLVVLDHGLGLQSIYSHLSEISVTLGQQVSRGETLGKTGVSGMAVGDHLHFGILVGGLEVSPIEWLDRKWIRDNITNRLRNAGTAAPEMPEPVMETPAAPASKQAPGKKKTRR